MSWIKEKSFNSKDDSYYDYENKYIVNYYYDINDNIY